MDDKSDESVIVRPPAGAACNNVTVPVDAVPALIGLALSWIEAGPEPQPRKLLVLVETLYREAVIVPVRFVPRKLPCNVKVLELTMWMPLTLPAALLPCSDCVPPIWTLLES